MENNEGFKRAYIRSSKAYYSKVVPSETVMVGLYHPEGGTSGEFQFEWININGTNHAQLKSFEDSWKALWMFKDLLEKMSEIDGDEIQEPEFCLLLDSLNITDITEYTERTNNR